MLVLVAHYEVPKSTLPVGQELLSRSRFISNIERAFMVLQGQDKMNCGGVPARSIGTEDLSVTMEHSLLNRGYSLLQLHSIRTVFAAGAR